MNIARYTPSITLLLTAATTVVASAAELKLGTHNFRLPDGFSIQQIDRTRLRFRQKFSETSGAGFVAELHELES